MGGNHGAFKVRNLRPHTAPPQDPPGISFRDAPRTEGRSSELTAVAARWRDHGSCSTWGDPSLGALPSLARRWREVAPQDRTASQDRTALTALHRFLACSVEPWIRLSMTI